MCYVLEHNIRRANRDDVPARSEKNVRCLRNDRRLKQNPETVERLEQKILHAFEKSERDNEQRLSDVIGTTINQTIELILKAERESDEKFKGIISCLPYYTQSDTYVKPRYYSHQFSMDLISQLK